MTRAERDKAIAAAFKSGAARNDLAAQYGLTPRRIGQIAAEHGVSRYHPDLVAAGLFNRGGRPHDPALSSLSQEDRKFYGKVMRLYGAAYARDALGLPKRGGGRRKLFVTDPAKRSEYFNLSRKMGAAYAREAMGLAA